MSASVITAFCFESFRFSRMFIVALHLEKKLTWEVYDKVIIKPVNFNSKVLKNL